MSSYVSPLVPYSLSLSLILVSNTIVVLAKLVLFSILTYLYIPTIYSMRHTYTHIYHIYLYILMSYKKSCDFCEQEITMTEKLGKWFPLSINNTPHVCFGSKKKTAASKEEQPQLKNLLEMTLLVQQMDERLRRVERIVVDPRV